MSNVEWKVLKSNADAERAQLNKILADIRSSLYSGGSGVGGPGTTDNTTVTRNFEDRLNAMAMAWRDTSARVLYYDNTIESIAQDITYLNARIDDIEVGGGDSEAIQILTARVIATEEGIISNSEFITELNAAVFDPDTGEVTWASAIEDLSVTVDGINDTVMAMYTLELDANGYVTGWKFTNDGTTGIVDFRTDRFKITAPGSVKGIEFADGIMMSVTPTHAYYQGVDFGGGGNFIAWYGPRPSNGPAGATGANGVFWIRNNGVAYFGGDLNNDKVAGLPVIEDHDNKIDDLTGRVDDIINQIGDLSGIPTWDVTKAYTKGAVVRHNGNLYLAIQNVPAGTNITNTAFWDLVGNYSTLGEAIAYAIDKSESNTTELAAQASRLSLLGAVNGSNNAFILDQNTVRITPTESLGQRLSSIQSQFGVTDARITSEVATLTAADAALASQTAVIQSSLQAVRNVEDASFELGTGWDMNFSPGSRFRRAASNARTGTWRLEATPGSGAASVVNNYEVPVEGSQRVRLSGWVTRNGTGTPPAGAVFRFTVRQYRDDRSYLGISYAVEDRSTDYFYKYYEGESTVHPDCRFVRFQITVDGLTDGFWSFDDMAITLVSRAEQATASIISDLQTSVAQHGNTLLAQASSISTLQASVGNNTASITQAMEVAAAAGTGNSLSNPSFEGTQGWSGTDSGISSWPPDFTTNTAAPRTGRQALRVYPGGDRWLYSTTRVPVRAGQTIRYSLWHRVGSTPNSGARIRIYRRGFDANGNYVSGSAGEVTSVPASSSSSSYSLLAGEWTVPSDGSISYAIMQIGVTSMTSGIFWIDDASMEVVPSLLEDVRARYSLSVNANGRIAGFQLIAGGSTSAAIFEADSFGVRSSGGNGLTWDDGTLWNRRGSYSLLTGPNLGENMLFYIGTTPSNPAAARKSDAIFYVDSSGTGYFAGQVLQGILRAFNSSTTVNNGSDQSVVTEYISSNNKPVALTAKFRNTYRQNYNGTGSTITLGSGNTQVRIRIRRQYEGSSTWTVLADEVIQGVDMVFSERDAPAWIMQSISGEVLGTDPASTQRRRYQIYISGLTRRQHTVTNPGTIPAPTFNQYASIESLE